MTKNVTWEIIKILVVAILSVSMLVILTLDVVTDNKNNVKNLNQVVIDRIYYKNGIKYYDLYDKETKIYYDEVNVNKFILDENKLLEDCTCPKIEYQLKVKNNMKFEVQNKHKE